MGIINTDNSKKEIKRIQPIVNKVLGYEEEYSKLTDKELQSKTQEFKDRLTGGETLDDILPEAFAVVREAGWRVVGLKAYEVQIMGGIIIHQGRIAEMATGAGKTLVSTMPVYLNALAGKGVHVVTVNDYLAKRDSEWMGKIYRFLGLSVGLIIGETPIPQRQKMYRCDITYGTNTEFGFDYLRDNMETNVKHILQRGHNFAIIDEIDSILIDEARTPLIISGTSEEGVDVYTTADTFVKSLKGKTVKEDEEGVESEDQIEEGDAYIHEEKTKHITLTALGIQKAEEFFNIENYSDRNNIELQHRINQALKAVYTMHKDIDYILRDGEIMIVDEYTGRIMDGRRFSDGLHQAIEAKEGVKINGENKTMATITLQNFFKLYSKFSGMTGTAMTEQEEFKQIYSLDVINIPTHRPIIRIDEEDEIYRTEKGKLNAIVIDIKEIHKKGQPILVGTSSVSKSEELSKLLKAEGIKHEVLNAKNHAKEAEIIAQAGTYGAVTISTNMAGRGTDIKLGGNPEFMARKELIKAGYEEDVIAEAEGYADTDNEQVIEARKIYQDYLKNTSDSFETESKKIQDLGGLYVIGAGRNDSRRIDNQLRGRSGRQGDPGRSKFYMSLEDELLRLFGSSFVESFMNAIDIDEHTPINSKQLTKQIEIAQKNVEANHFKQRKTVLEYDNVINEQRKIIYEQRAKVLYSDNVRDYVKNMIEDSLINLVFSFCPDSDKELWDTDGLRKELKEYGITLGKGEILDRKTFLDGLLIGVEKILDDKIHKYGYKNFDDYEKKVLLKNIDNKWVNYNDDAAFAKKAVGLNAISGKDPVLEYKILTNDMFNEMTSDIKSSTAKAVMNMRLIGRNNMRNAPKIITNVSEGVAINTQKKEEE